MSIKENVLEIREKIDAAARGSGRSGRDVLLVAAAKMNPAARVREAVEAGVDAIGENRVQEMTEKSALGAYTGACLHFIGHLQKNKVGKVVGACDLIESADSLGLLRLIDARARSLGIVQDVLLEVNIANEATKSGFLPGQLQQAAQDLPQLGALRVRGLMAIPPNTPEIGGNRGYFTAMRKLFVDIAEKRYDNVSMDFLSMGMSGDYLDAIAEGANVVRIGAAIFGARVR